MNVLLSRRTVALWLSLAALLLLTADSVRAQSREPAPPAPPPASCASPKQCLDQAAQSYLRDGAASAVQIAIWKEGRFVYSEAFGFSDPQRKRPATTHSLFQVGSNTKKATALALLRAVEAGRVDLDDTVARALPFFKLQRAPDWAAEVTLRDLLSHQSGLWDYTPGYEAAEDWRLQQILWTKFKEHEWVTTPPRASFSYANANYALVAAILERAYGRSYPEIMEREVYGPLRLSHTHARQRDALATGRAVWGYGLEPDMSRDPFDLEALLRDPPWAGAPQWISPADHADNAFLRPAGLSWSTAEDECRIGAFLVDGQRDFLSDRSRDEMVAPRTPITPGDPQLSYAFGLMIAPTLGLSPEAWYDVPSWMHSGSTLTMASLFLVLPNQRLVIAVLRNARDPSPAVDALMATALTHYAQLPPKHAAPPVPPDDGARYAGTYSDPEGLGTLALSWDGATLSVSAPEIEALGLSVGPTAKIVRPNVLLVPIAGRSYPFTVWPAANESAAYLVGREDSFTRVEP